MTFDYWYNYETSLAGRHKTLAKLVWDAARRETAKECVEICDHLTGLGYTSTVTSMVVYKIKEKFGLEI